MLQSLRHTYIPTKPQEHLKENEVIPFISYNTHLTFIWGALKYLKNFKFLRKLRVSIFMSETTSFLRDIFVSSVDTAAS